MRIKTFMAPTPEALDTVVNTFDEQHDVVATQTHIIQPQGEGGTARFVAVVFYKGEAKKPAPKTEAPATDTEEEERVCADCGKEVSDNVYTYSQKWHKKTLCMDCQKNHKK